MTKNYHGSNEITTSGHTGPRLKPGSEREGHTSFSHASSVTYLQIFTTNFNFCKFYIVQILKESSQWKSCNKILAFKKIAL
jgi:hypothetical protein